MMYLQEAALEFAAPMTQNGNVDLDGVLSFTLHNAGTATVTLEGTYTLAPGATFNGGLPGSALIVAQKIRVIFGATGNRRLEIGLVRLKGEQYSNYTRKSQ